MPHIKQEQKDYLAEGNVARTAGEVNYLVSILMNAYFGSYDDLNEIATEIECAITGLIVKGCCPYNEKTGFGKELVAIVMNCDLESKPIIGALRNSYSEFYALIAREYEDKKIQENGSAFGTNKETEKVI